MISSCIYRNPDGLGDFFRVRHHDGQVHLGHSIHGYAGEGDGMHGGWRDRLVIDIEHEQLVVRT